MSLLGVNPGQLFQQNSVSEIEQVRLKIHNEIEKKKEDLQIMVGERYRDLIDAADSITNMTKLSSDIITNLNEISKGCNTIRNSTIKPHFDSKVSKVDNFSSQMKLLIDINQQIWKFLDEKNVLYATVLYYYAFFIKTNINVEFPNCNILNVQWDNMKHFQGTIVKQTEKQLLECDTDNSKTCNYLITLLFLENLNLEKLFERFIRLRSNAINNCFSNDTSSENVKNCIICSHDIIVNTIQCSYEIFNKLLLTQLDQLYQVSILDILNNDENMKRNLKYLPEMIKTYTINPVDVQHLQSDYLHDHVLEWLSSVKSDVRIGLTKLLKLVFSLKLIQDIHSSVDKQPAVLKNTLSSIGFADDMNVWKEMYEPLVLDKATQLISIKWTQVFDSIYGDIIKSIKQCNNDKNKESELDLRWYTWKDSNNDLETYDNKKASSNLSSSSNIASLLLLKSQGFTPRVINLITIIQNKIYLLDNKLQTISNLNIDNVLSKHQVQCCKQSIVKLCEFVKEQTESDNVTQSTCVLLVRLLQCLGTFCPVLKYICQDHHWQEVSAIITMNRNKVIDKYITITCQHYIGMFKDLNQGVTKEYILKNLTRWEIINIEETNENGIVTDTNIQVPIQPSIILQTQLHSFMLSVSRLMLSSHLYDKLMGDILEHILSTYQSIREDSGVNKKLMNRMNTQYLFDLRLIVSILLSKSNKPLLDKFERKIKEIEDCLDPFELEVISQHLSNNINNCVTTTQSLINVKPALTTPTLSTPVRNENSSIIQISDNIKWFPVILINSSLPVQSNVNIVKNVTESKQQQQASTTASLQDKLASSFFTVTDWFG